MIYKWVEHWVELDLTLALSGPGPLWDFNDKQNTGKNRASLALQKYPADQLPSFLFVL